MWAFVLKMEYQNNVMYSLNCFLIGIHRFIIKLHQPEPPQLSAVQAPSVPGPELLLYACGAFSPVYRRVGLPCFMSHLFHLIF